MLVASFEPARESVEPVEPFRRIEYVARYILKDADTIPHYVQDVRPLLQDKVGRWFELDRPLSHPDNEGLVVTRPESISLLISQANSVSLVHVLLTAEGRKVQLDILFELRHERHKAAAAERAERQRIRVLGEELQRHVDAWLRAGRVALIWRTPEAWKCVEVLQEKYEAFCAKHQEDMPALHALTRS